MSFTVLFIGTNLDTDRLDSKINIYCKNNKCKIKQISLVSHYMSNTLSSLVLFEDLK